MGPGFHHQSFPSGPWILAYSTSIKFGPWIVSSTNLIWALNFNINQFHLHPGFFNQSVLSGPWIFISISSIWALNCIINHTRRTLDFIISQSHQISLGINPIWVLVIIVNQFPLGPGFYHPSISNGPRILLF